MARKTTSRFDLHEALSKHSYDHAVICTFTFETTFFEEYCIEKFNSLSNNGNITVLLDRGTYDKAILGPESQRPQKANLRYLLHPISVPGVFHPKIFLFVSRTRARMIIGSANFTRPGITSNAEIVGRYDYEHGKDESNKDIIQSTFRYLTAIGEHERWRSDALISNLQAINRDAPWLTNVGEPKAVSRRDDLLHNLDTSIWEQIIATAEPPVDTVYILSRYFDAHPTIIDRVVTDLHPRKIKIFTQNGVTNMTPDWLRHPLLKNGKVEILFCQYKDGGCSQPLHAKSIIIEKDGKCLLCFGSANFTSAALLRTVRSGNVEVMLKTVDVPSEQLQPERFLDPGNTAVHLKSEKELQSIVSDEEIIVSARHAINLIEATLDLSGETINLKADIPSTIKDVRLIASLTFPQLARKSLELSFISDGEYSINISKDINQRVNSHSTIIQIEAYSGTEKIADSNSLLITNLKDVKTDKPVKRERHIKEAQQSAAQFFIVLRDLIGSGDDEALLVFLNFCDIPFTGAPRSPMFRSVRLIWDGGTGMRSLGEKNLKIYTHLHEAAVAFFDKHFRKLRRHLESRDLNGTANFLHIFLAMGGILRAQIERALIGLESKSAPLSTEEWATFRKHMDTYYLKFKQLMVCLSKEYFLPLTKEYTLGDIREEFKPDLQPIHDLCFDMINYRERLEGLRVSRLSRLNSTGKLIAPAYFYCLLGPELWPKYSLEVKAELERVERIIGYAA
ncbi:MAG: phospholipase D-like domain-containing protein [Acidobacteria bacterium]|nr:phospholipase D-like domain-containing protein [Acidobacteriota bacterium]